MWWCLVLGAGCAPRWSAEVGDGVTVQRAHALKQGAGPLTELSFELLVTAEDGAPVDCDGQELDLDVVIHLADGSTVPVKAKDLQVRCEDEAVADVSLVLDNSGSQAGVLGEVREGSTRLVDTVLGTGGRVSLVRASTFSQPLTDVTEDEGTLLEAIDGMFVNAGWTALWDAVRMGNETLEAAPSPDPTPACLTRRSAELVLFTNGVDNNSDEARLTRDGAGDGVDTTLEDVLALAVQGAPTPIHTIGLGDDLDSQLLAEISAATGGGHLAVQRGEAIDAAFELVATWVGEQRRVCTEVELPACEPVEVEITYDFRGKRKCNQGLGNGWEGCDPGDSNHTNPSNDEPDSPGRGNGDPQSDAAGTGPDELVEIHGTQTVVVVVPCDEEG
ncbi:MAG: VWA domain-containing protein [Alphaproteobacteria bacterium]|nr:VWA domain-containing protein [Alphaproteobacteria bacterium]